MRQCHLITNFNEVMSEKALIKCLLLNCCWGLWWFYHNTVLSLITVKIKCRGTLWNCNYSWSLAVLQRLSWGCINSCLSKTIMVQFVVFFNRFRLWHSNNHLFMILGKKPKTTGDTLAGFQSSLLGNDAERVDASKVEQRLCNYTWANIFWSTYM